jgi:hypothetical protein
MAELTTNNESISTLWAESENGELKGKQTIIKEYHTHLTSFLDEIKDRNFYNADTKQMKIILSEALTDLGVE